MSSRRKRRVRALGSWSPNSRERWSRRSAGGGGGVEGVVEEEEGRSESTTSVTSSSAERMLVVMWWARVWHSGLCAARVGREKGRVER